MNDPFNLLLVDIIITQERASIDIKPSSKSEQSGRTSAVTQAN